MGASMAAPFESHLSATATPTRPSHLIHSRRGRSRIRTSPCAWTKVLILLLAVVRRPRPFPPSVSLRFLVLWLRRIRAGGDVAALLPLLLALSLLPRHPDRLAEMGQLWARPWRSVASSAGQSCTVPRQASRLLSTTNESIRVRSINLKEP